MSEIERAALLGGQPTTTIEAHGRWPIIGERERTLILAALAGDELWGVHTPPIRELERDWATYLGVRHCVAVNSGTAALHCATAALGIEPADEVIVPAFTFAATAMAVVQQGATPVFCDIDPVTYNIDARLIVERVSDRTKAVIPVHLHGLPADMDEIHALATAHGLEVIEDAAQAHGAVYRGRKVGTIGSCSAFSLNATKPLPGGEGGLFVTDDPLLERTARRLSIFGEDPPAVAASDRQRAYLCHGVGYNYRQHVLSAALARAQLQVLDEHNARARANAAILTQGLDGIDGLTAPWVPADRTPVFHKYRIRVEPAALEWSGKVAELRDLLVRALRAEGVEAVLWQSHPLPSHPAFRKPGRPWHPNQRKARLRAYDPDEFPHAHAALASTIVLGSERAPLAAQPPELMHAYVDAIAKVAGQIDELKAQAAPRG